MQIHAVPRSTVKTISIFWASVCLAVFAPAALAQRGGGGARGGGGFHGGGFHGGGGASTHVSGGARGSAGASSARGGRGGAGYAAGGYASSHPSAEERYGSNTFVSQTRINGRNYTVVGSHAYAADNRLWADPDQAAHRGAPAMAATPSSLLRRPGGFATVPGGAATDPHGPYSGMILPLHNFRHGFGFGFGFGLRPCWIINPCGFGYGLGYGYGLFGGYGNGWFYPTYDDEEATEPGVEETYPSTPDFTAEYYNSEPPFLPPPPENAQAQGNGPLIELVLTDQTVFPVESYWLQDNKLYYVTTYNIKTSIPLSELDLQKTVDMNYKRGVTFSLTPQPPQSQENPQDNPQSPDSQQD